MQDGDHPLSVHGLRDVLEYSELYGFLSVIEFIVCGHNDKDDRRIRPSDLSHRVDTVDTGHLNVHDRDIGPEALGKLDNAPARLCGRDLALRSEFLFNDESEGIDHDPFVIRQHDPVHKKPLSQCVFSVPSYIRRNVELSCSPVRFRHTSR